MKSKSVLAIAALLFLVAEKTESADVQLFSRISEETIQHSSQLYYAPSVSTYWVWTPYGWTIQTYPSYSFYAYGHNHLIKRRDNVRYIDIHNAGSVYISKDGTIKVYDKKPVSSSYISDLRRIHLHYRNRQK